MSGMILTTRAFVSRNNSFQRTPVRGEAVTSSGRCHKAVSRVEAVTDGDRRHLGKPLIWGVFGGGADRDRTDDLLNAIRGLVVDPGLCCAIGVDSVDPQIEGYQRN